MRVAQTAGNEDSMSTPSVPGLYRGRIHNDESCLVNVFMFCGELRCHVMGSDETLRLTDFQDLVRVRVVPFTTYDLPGAICPHCGRQGIQGYDAEPCFCPDCHRDIAVT